MTDTKEKYEANTIIEIDVTCGCSFVFGVRSDGGEGGGGVWPYYNAGDAVKLTAGDTLVLRVMSGDNSAPTTASVAIAGIQNQ